MCDFINWIETPEGILYLTDKEIFSRKLRKIEMKGNDYIGHGAIRKYYNIPPCQYEEHEVGDFWNIEKLPPELAEKLTSWETFYKYWGKAWESGAFQNDDLCYIIAFAPEPYAEKAWERLLAQNTSNYDLRYIIDFAPEPYRGKASIKLLEQNPSNYELRLIIECVPEPYKEKAWNKLLEQSSNSCDIRYIIEYAPEPYEGKAWDRLIAQNPSNDALIYIVDYAPESYSEKARNILQERKDKLI